MNAKEHNPPPDTCPRCDRSLYDDDVPADRLDHYQHIQRHGHCLHCQTEIDQDRDRTEALDSISAADIDWEGEELTTAADSRDMVNHPDHYGGDRPREAIKIIEEYGLGFHAGSAVKYIIRAGKKPNTPELEDLQKARWYIERRIQQLAQGGGVVE